jgi:hypothetical protein
MGCLHLTEFDAQVSVHQRDGDRRRMVSSRVALVDAPSDVVILEVCGVKPRINPSNPDHVILGWFHVSPRVRMW